MANNYYYVRALTSGPWKGIDVFNAAGERYGERVVVMAMEEGQWNVDNECVAVWPGLVVSFRDFADAEWFLSQDRARWLLVEPGMALAFASESDASFFMRKNLGEAISRQQAEDIWNAAAAAAGYGGGAADIEADQKTGEVITLDKTKLENKALKGAPETKKDSAPPKKAAGKKGK